MPTIDFTDAELAAVAAAIRRTIAVTAAIRGVIADDKYPHAPRLDPLRAALARLEAAGRNQDLPNSGEISKAPPAAKADKRSRR
jgi:hypothetical protein